MHNCILNMACFYLLRHKKFFHELFITHCHTVIKFRIRLHAAPKINTGSIQLLLNFIKNTFPICPWLIHLIDE